MNKFSGKKSSDDIKKKYLESLGEDYGEFQLGKNTTKILYESPNNLLFTLSRYKFVLKMFTGFEKVLEVGCQEGFGANLVSKVVGKLDAVDFYIPYIESFKRRINDKKINVFAHDILDGPLNNQYNGIFALDVLEHIEQKNEDLFMKNIVRSLDNNGTVILGMPSLESQIYASQPSKIGHVNCKTGCDLAKFTKKYFRNVFSFSMNDEVLHTGFFPMSHYLFVMCCNKIS